MVSASTTETTSVDPISLDLSLLLGGAGTDTAGSAILDSQGNIILAATTNSQDIITSNNVVQSSSSGGFDCLVFKLNPSGEIIFASYLGGSGDEGARAVGVDSNDNIIIAGFTTSQDFPISSGASQEIFGGGAPDGDSFVAKISSNGQSILWATYYGGNGDEHLTNMAVDSDDNIIITGRTGSSNLTTTVNALQSEYSGSYDAFVAKLNPSGSSLLYSSYLGGTEEDSGSGVTLDSNNNAILTGVTASSDFPTNASCYQPTYGGGENDAYITKIDLNSGDIEWSTFLGATGNDIGVKIATNNQDHVFLVGFTTSDAFPTTQDAFQETHGGVNDAFVSEVSADGETLLFGSFFGGNNWELGSDIVITPEENIIVIGRSSSEDLPITRAYQEENAGFYDAFMFKMNGENQSIEYSTYIGGDGNDYAWNILIDSNCNPIVFGWTDSSNFPGYDGGTGGFYDVFLCRFSTQDVSAGDLSIPLIVLVSGLGIMILIIAFVIYRKR